MARTQRIRDPVHGLIVFREGKPLDQLAWALINTPEFQRLRRIKQLGFTEFVFPGATHTRFAHCIGVFETSRRLVEIIERKIGRGEDRRVQTAVLAALLHDIGHGPFSHAFEQAQRSQGIRKRHEEWSAQLIRDPEGSIKPLLEEHSPGLADAVADLLAAETPTDIYDAIVSSSFDADRLDYLRRDRLMSGSGAGAIDFDWLMENLRVETIDIEPDGDQPGISRVSFCLDLKALQATEAFLLARFHLYTQVYLHKATRGMEQMFTALIRAVAEAAGKSRFADANIEEGHPIIRFFNSKGKDKAAYLALDDSLIWASLERFSEARDGFIRDIARRLRNRVLFKSLDIEGVFGESAEPQRRAIRRIERDYASEMNRTVLRDRATITAYGIIGADDAEAQKRLMIRTSNGLREITELSPAIRALADGTPRVFTRFYFADEAARDRAREGR
jgi:HD superfamily phosphohydrolase